jgi:hypothetical protein
MKKLILAIITILSITLTSCSQTKTRHIGDKNQVHCYKQYDNVTNSWLFYYMLLSSNGNHYYYTSSTYITSYSSINSWNTTSPTGFNENTATDMGITSVDNSGLNTEFTESQGFEQSDNTQSTESNGFESSENTSDESSGFESSINESSSESSSGDSGGDSGGGE